MLTHQACIFVNALKSKFESNLSLLWSVFCLMDDFDLFSAWFKVYGTVQRTLGNFFANFCHSLKRLGWCVVLYWSFMTKSGMLWQINQPGCDRQQHTLCQNRNSPPPDNDTGGGGGTQGGLQHSDNRTDWQNIQQIKYSSQARSKD